MHNKDLINNLVELIEKNIDDNTFNIDSLSSSIKMSRSVLFKKVKEITGHPPIRLIHDIKMKKAAQLLRSGEFLVKEIPPKIGVSDLKYFGICFKAKYGMPPQKYKKEMICNKNY